jgi:hemerythrin
MIQWDKQYELGIESIDNQHKHLIEITSTLSNLLTSAVEGQDIYDDMLAIIEQLSQYTVFHFKYEEALFEKHGYVDQAQHKIEHNKLISEIEAIDLKTIDEDQITYGKKLLRFLISWVFKHISGSDFLYRDHLIHHGVN